MNFVNLSISLNNMERIVLEVDDTVGKIYYGFSDEVKTRFKETISLMLKKTINDASLDAYKFELDKLGNTAVANGLTEEALNDMLADD